MTVAINVGTRFPAHATSMGHVLLAGLSDADLEAYLVAAKLDTFTQHTITSAEALRAEIARVREQGWALVDQELESGLRSIAVPLHDRDAHVIAAMNVSTQASRTTPTAVRREMLPTLQSTATRIEADLALAGPTRRSG
jgi:IclR family pca regulon transcriptional regulator